MDALDDTDAQARRIERDIERTRDEMDHTLTELERRLAPSEMLHEGARTIRERVRGGVTRTVDALTRHPGSLALGAAIIGATFALRPSASERLEQRAEQDFDRLWAALATAVDHAKRRSQVGAATLADQTWQTLRRARDESLDVSRVFQREAAARPLGALLLLGLAAGVASVGARGLRAWR
jgi:hypothetical protein